MRKFLRRVARSGWGLASVLFLTPWPLAASTLTLVSAADPGLLSDTAGGPSYLDRHAGDSGRRISADGRYCVFVSEAINLVPGQVDANSQWLPPLDVFLYDRETGARTLVSHSRLSAMRTGNGASLKPVISADGRFVAFVSYATDLVPGVNDPSEGEDVFLYERTTGSITLVSHAALSAETATNSPATQLSLSADGRYLAFESRAAQLVPGQDDTNGDFDVFLYDRASGTTALVSHRAESSLLAAGAVEDDVAISSDGSAVVFTSLNTDLIPLQDDTAFTSDVFLYARDSGVIALVSRSSTAVVKAGNASSSGSSISRDGRYVAFWSEASNLMSDSPGPSAYHNVFQLDRVTGVMRLVSHAEGSAVNSGDGDSDTCRMSGNGRFVAFRSSASNLVSGLTVSTVEEVYLWDLQSGGVTLVSDTAEFASAPSFTNVREGSLQLSDDGEVVIFASRNVYLYRRSSGTLVLASHRVGAPATNANADSTTAALSADGSAVLFDSMARDLAVGSRDFSDWNDVFLYTPGTGSTVLVSRHAPDLPSLSAGRDSLLSFRQTSISADGRYVAFDSSAVNLVPGHQEGGGYIQVFLWDRLTGARLLVSRSASAPSHGGNGTAMGSVISADGRFVSFVSNSTDLIPGQPDGVPSSDQVYLFDRSTGAIALVSRKAGSLALPATGGSGNPLLSADGRYVAFLSTADNLVAGQIDTNFAPDLFLFDRLTGSVELVSHTPTSPVTATGTNSFPQEDHAISADGRFVAFTSTAGNLVPDQAPGALGPPTQLFLYDHADGTNRLVSGALGSPRIGSDSSAYRPDLSADGRYVAYVSTATNAGLAVANGGNFNVFTFDRVTGATRLVSHAASSPSTAADDGWSFTTPAISADGRFITYVSDATNLVAGQVDRASSFDTFLWNRETGQTLLVSHTASSPVTSSSAPEGSLASWGPRPSISADGRYVAFLSDALDLVPGQTGAAQRWDYDLFLFDRLGAATELVDHTMASDTESTWFGGAPPVLSADGSSVAFVSGGRDLTPSDFSAVSKVFLFRRTTSLGKFFTVPPCRVADTRAAGQTPVRSGVEEAWPLYAICGIPSTARAISVNLTIVSPTGDGFLTLFSGDQPLPPTSTINFRAGQVRANNAVVPLALDGSGRLGVSASLSGTGLVHVVLDVNGYFE